MRRFLVGVRRQVLHDLAYLVNDEYGGFLLDDGGKLRL